MFTWLANKLGKGLARYLSKPRRHYTTFDVTDPDMLASVLQPGDVLLVDGLSRISTGIKYLTQSTWSHAAMYVGDFKSSGLDAGSAPVLTRMRNAGRNFPMIGMVFGLIQIQRE